MALKEVLDMSVETEIRSLINLKGKITFAEFMDIAMFSPEYGYYNSPRIWGVQGDYYTSPMVHPCYSAMQAIQLFQISHVIEKPDTYHLVEVR